MPGAFRDEELQPIYCMKTNKKKFRLIWHDGLYLAVEAGSARAAHDYVNNHMPFKAFKSLLLAYFGVWNMQAYYAYTKIRYGYGCNNKDEFIKIGNSYAIKL